MRGSGKPGWKLIAAFWAAFLGYGIWLFNFGPYAWLARSLQGTSLPEERFGFTGSDLYVFAESLEGKALEGYGMFQLADVPNAFLMSLAFGATIWALAYFVSRSRYTVLLAFIPLLTGMLDTAENALIITSIRNLPLKYYGVAEAAGTVSFFKFLSWISGALTMLVLIIISAVKLFRIRRQNES